MGKCVVKGRRLHRGLRCRKLGVSRRAGLRLGAAPTSWFKRAGGKCGPPGCGGGVCMLTWPHMGFCLCRRIGPRGRRKWGRAGWIGQSDGTRCGTTCVRERLAHRLNASERLMQRVKTSGEHPTLVATGTSGAARPWGAVPARSQGLVQGLPASRAVEAQGRGAGCVEQRRAATRPATTAPKPCALVEAQPPDIFNRRARSRRFQRG